VALTYFRKRDRLSFSLIGSTTEALQLYPEAAAALEALLKQAPNDRAILSSLVIAYSQFDCKAAEKYEKMLPPLPLVGVDVNKLEDSPSFVARAAAKSTRSLPLLYRHKYSKIQMQVKVKLEFQILFEYSSKCFLTARRSRRGRTLQGIR
jgi:hypothetical protein